MSYKLPPITDVDIQRSASLMVDMFGQNAHDRCSEMVFKLQKRKNTTGLDVWIRICAAIQAQQSPRPGN